MSYSLQFIRAAILFKKNYTLAMRLLVVLLGLLLPLSGLAAPICPAGYLLNDLAQCEQKWDISTGNCPEGSYFDKRSNKCLPRCPYRSQDEVSNQGDRVCQKNGKREWLEEYRRLCANKGFEYLPQIDMCLVPPARPAKEEVALDCPKGKVWRLRDSTYSCVKGDPLKVLRQLKAQLESKGLTYLEYLEAIKDIQTNKFAAEVMQYRWEEASGVRQTKAQKEDAIKAATQCPAEYEATEQGGCKPAKSCREYGCPEGQISELFRQGKNQYCRCREDEQPAN
jgi:hypothetical protein